MHYPVFSADSFWNQPIAPNTPTDTRSDHILELLQHDPYGGFGISARHWTIPVYHADATTPRYTVHDMRSDATLLAQAPPNWSQQEAQFRHGSSFAAAAVPLPPDARPDTQADAHLVIIDKDENTVYDLWGACKKQDQSWSAKCGMRYALNGSGVFDEEELGPRKDGDSIHFYGPCRASGVPAVAGLVMHAEVLSGAIRHKLAIATRYGALQEYLYPARWTDGGVVGGFPEGGVLQLDPALDLGRFDLLPGERIVAEALQCYGGVNVDMAGGSVVYAEGLHSDQDNRWEGLLDVQQSGLKRIPITHFRVIQMNGIICRGDRRLLGVNIV